MSSFYSASPLLIEQSVGRDGKNLPPDVRTVQSMLNAKLPHPLLPLNVSGICDWFTINTIETYQRHNLRVATPSGRIDPGDATLRSLKEVPVKQSTGKKHTISANEVLFKKTRITAHEIVPLVLLIWPDMHPTGARTLAAQSMAETAGGEHCYNWNIGNKKSKSTTDPHMYFGLIWECLSKSVADSYVAKGRGLARIATADEITYYGKKYGWKCQSVMTLFSAPHEQCRFRAYASLREGVEDWLDLHKRIARSNPDYLKALQAADTAAAAKALWKAKYYTAAEADYAAGMKAQKKQVDAALGPLPPPWK